jgi:hypothetical protein
MERIVTANVGFDLAATEALAATKSRLFPLAALPR